jgi:Plant transposon protein
MVAVVRQLSYGIPADACVEYVRLSESTCNESLHRFCRAVVEEVESEWLRLPTVSEIEEIERHYAKLGFPGCIGCVDCASWEWDACPVGWQEAYKGKTQNLCVAWRL